MSPLRDSLSRKEAPPQTLPKPLRRTSKVSDVEALAITYQPILNLKTGLIEKCEALCRPREAGADLGAFFDSAERNGSIRTFNEQILNEVFADWLKFGAKTIAVSINLSVTNLSESDLVKRIEKALKKQRFDPKNLWFEFDVRAQSLTDQTMLLTLRDLSNLGIRTSIDSFGNDFSQATLYEVEALGVNELKVDGRYVRDADENMRHRGVVTATVDLAKHLRIGVSAKGIEDAGIAALMLRLGCTHGQGYYFARPMGPRVLAELVEKMASAGPMPTGR